MIISFGSKAKNAFNFSTWKSCSLSSQIEESIFDETIPEIREDLIGLFSGNLSLKGNHMYDIKGTFYK
jgi:hypothetical protein